jgi:CrcB protein
VTSWLAVGLGSALGALARFALSLQMLEWLGPDFPWGTLVVNGLGAALIGIMAEVMKPPGPLDLGPYGRPFMLTGFCGGFTTFSIFSLETLLLWTEADALVATAYVVASVALWVAAVLAGVAVGRRLIPAR